MVIKHQSFDRETLDKNVWELSLERMREAYEMFDTIKVMFSGGKDSTVVLHATLEVAKELGRLPVEVIHFDEEALSMETEEYVRRVSERDDVDFKWLCIPIKHRNATSRQEPYWYPWDPEKKELWVRDMPPEAITEVPGFLMWPAEKRPATHEMNGLLCSLDEGTVGIVFGVRAAESLIRQKAVSWTNKTFNWIAEISTGTFKGERQFGRKGIYKLYPVYDWTDEDVWTAPDKFGWDYNSSYDIMDMYGLSLGKQRLAPPYGEEPMGNLDMWAECFPDVWDKMVNRVKGANTGAKYSKTVLYAHTGRPPKPDDMTWEEWISMWLEMSEPKVRKKIAENVKELIKFHYGVTPEPILPRSIHYESGISWEYLTTIAMRGNLKARRQPKRTLDPVIQNKIKLNYYKELNDMRMRGIDDTI